jgi:adenosylcobyric acid synthase
MWRGHGLPEEDGVFDDTPHGSGLDIAVVAYPRISNLDEFQPLRGIDGVRLRWVRDAAALAGADWIVLPGSKHTSGDLAWLRERGIDAAIARHAAAGGRVLGVCGGLQMLGEALVDPHGIDGNAPGLGLLPLVTQFERDKLLVEAPVRFAALSGQWAAISGLQARGYEIRQGRTVTLPGAGLDVALTNAQGDAIGWQKGSVMGVYAHGLFESATVLQALFGHAVRPLDAVFDGLADFIDLHFRPGSLAGLLEPCAP